MARSTIYSFAKHCFLDYEFNCGGIAENEDKYIKDIGLSSEDEAAFFNAMFILCKLNRKYQKGKIK